MPWPSNKPQPKNAGTPWTPELDIELLHLLSENTTIEECALHFERTVGGISARQLVIAKDLIEKGSHIDDVSKIVNVPALYIQQSIESENIRKAKSEKRKQDKKQEKNTIQPKITDLLPKVTNDTPVSILKEIRDLLKEFDKRLNILEKNGKDEPVYL